VVEGPEKKQLFSAELFYPVVAATTATTTTVVVSALL